MEFQPETIEELRARFHFAIEDTLDKESLQLGAQLPPDENRKHVFDLENGVRLIISKENTVPRLPLHVVANIRPQLFLESEDSQHLVSNFKFEHGGESPDMRDIINSFYDIIESSFESICTLDPVPELKYVGINEETGMMHFGGELGD